jgi:hypothetical protein
VFGGQPIGRREYASSALCRRALDGDWYRTLAHARGSVAAAVSRWRDPLARSLALRQVQGFYTADPDDISARALYDDWSSSDDGARQWWPRGHVRRPRGSARARTAGAHSSRRRRDPHRAERARRAGADRSREAGAGSRRRAPSSPFPWACSRPRPSSSGRGSPRAKREAIRQIGMGDVVKVVVRCRPFWGELRFIASDRDVPVWWPLPARRGADSVLVGWVGGPAAAALAGRSAEEIKVIALHSLRRLFPRAPAIAPADVFVANWSREPFTRGAYTYDRSPRGPALRDAPRAARRPPVVLRGRGDRSSTTARCTAPLRAGAGRPAWCCNRSGSAMPKLARTGWSRRVI